MLLNILSTNLSTFIYQKDTYFRLLITKKKQETAFHVLILYLSPFATSILYRQHKFIFFSYFLCFSKKVVTFANRKIAKQTILLYKNYMKRKLTLLLTCLLAGISLAIAQTSRKVMGVVFSEEDNQPVIGASVLVKGTSIGTTTDLDGKFVINNVPSSSRTW